MAILTLGNNNSAFSGSFSGSYSGDGSALTGISTTPFPFTGDASITGSLTISGSFIPRGPGVSSDTNVVIGKDAGTKLVGGGTNNVFVGESAGKNLDDEDNNVFIGSGAGEYMAHAGSNGNILIGANAGNYLTGQLGVAASQPVGNIFIGYYAGQGFTIHNTQYTQNNIGIGDSSLINISSGNQNVTIGKLTGNKITTGYNNIIIGYEAGVNASGSSFSNIVIGHSASLATAGANSQLFIGSGSVALISGSLADGGLKILGQVSASSYIGDGSGLTGRSTTPFPFTGDAVITGSLVISASNNTSESLSIQGSGSTIFSIQGSQGQLFSVTDDLLDEVFSVADISGDTLLSVSGSGLVTIPVGDLTGSATATASYGAFKGDGSQLTNLPASSTFPFTGDAVISGSLLVSGSSGVEINNSLLVTGSGANITIANTLSGTQNSFEILNNSNQKIFQVGNQDKIVFGAGATATDGTSLVWGGAATSQAQYAVVLGYSADHTTGTRGIAIGLHAQSTEIGAIAIGAGAYAHKNSVTIGRNVAYSGTPENSLVFSTFGGNNVTYSTSNAFEWYNTHATAPNLRFLTGPTSQSFWSGSGGFFGFGTTTPDAPLTVEGSGSTLFNVIGSEVTIFSLEDDLDGTLITVNDRSGIPMFEVSASGRIVAEEGESIIRSQRPMVTHTADFSITSSLDFAGKYHIVGGNLTCSINTGSLVPAGAEFEFFQTSSVGNFLFMTGSPHVDLIVKNDNLNLAGRGSGATLKYIGESTFHLVGDLT